MIDDLRNSYEVFNDVVVIHLKRDSDDTLFTTVSLSALQKLLDFKTTWYARWEPDSECYVVKAKVAGPNGKQRDIRLSRYLSDCSDNEYVLHRNGDTLDNRYENLVVTKRNRTGAVRKKRVGAVGVGFDERRLMWYVVIERNCVKEHIGYFLSEAKANEVFQQYNND